MRWWMHGCRRGPRPDASRARTSSTWSVGSSADVPWERRQLLLVDVADRLQSLPEHVRPEDVLGDPRAYARLVREAAGLPRSRVAPFPYFRALRLRNKILVIVVPLLTALVGGGLTAMRHYQPLRADSYVFSSSAPRVDARYVTDVDFSRYRLNATVVSGLHLTNRGRATVTVTGARMPGNSPLKVTELRTRSDPRLTSDWKQAQRVHRVSVHPGESVTLYVVMKMIPYVLAPDDGE